MIKEKTIRIISAAIFFYVGLALLCVRLRGGVEFDNE